MINGQSLGTSVVEIDEYRLVVRDQYGFYLIFSYPEQTLYDESADTSYKLLSENRSLPMYIYILYKRKNESSLSSFVFVVKRLKILCFYLEK